MKPRKSILDPSFKYVPSHKTDVLKTIRREQARLAALAKAGEKVTPIRRRKA